MATKGKVLLIYTGGTIGMVEDHETGSLKAFDFEHLIHQVPELSRIEAELVAESLGKPIDSSDMNPTNWQDMAKKIASNYEQYDGFVILHGTDTMAYTASALSFMLQGLKKPVILTGSQLPVGKIRTDGKENIITSIEIAAARTENGESIIQEVAVYFEDFLYRGNRTTKVSAHAFDAFRSPNFYELATAGIDIRYNHAACFRTKKAKLQPAYKMDAKVALLKIFPGFSIEIYKRLFKVNEVKAVVMESFGSGNIPNSDLFHQMIADYQNEGGIVVNITQCSSGSVAQGKYLNSAKLNEIGVISGRDLTTEAALTKIMFLLGNYSSTKTIKKLMEKNIAGELSL